MWLQHHDLLRPVNLVNLHRDAQAHCASDPGKAVLSALCARGSAGEGPRGSQVHRQKRNMFPNMWLKSVNLAVNLTFRGSPCPRGSPRRLCGAREVDGPRSRGRRASRLGRFDHGRSAPGALPNLVIPITHAMRRWVPWTTLKPSGSQPFDR
jgi:hypothetical protein